MNAVYQLAARFGIQISNRVCGGYDLNQPAYNGKDIAGRWLKVTYSNGTDDSDNALDEPLYSEAIPLSAHDLLHEIAHWVAAAPEQRDLPEYGLGAIVFSTYHMMDDIPRVVDFGEDQIQENVCWLLCVYWGRKYNIPVDLSEDIGRGEKYAQSWDQYESLKNTESQIPGNEWSMAIARDRFRKLLDQEERL